MRFEVALAWGVGACSTPGGERAEITVKERDSAIAARECSTPGGERAEITSFAFLRFL